MIGERVGGYEIIGLLGRGANGAVWLAEDPSADPPRVALKVLHGHLADDPDALTRFRREFAALDRLRHPRIVRALDAPTRRNGTVSFPMELVRGRSLAELVDERGTLTPAATGRLLLEIADGLACAHGEGVVHRDLKPSNVILDRDGAARITDFGLARITTASSDGPTRTGDVLGTPSFMAPEQASGEGPVGPPADLYALGCVAFFALAGRPPFRAADPLAVLRAHIEDAPPSIDELVPDIPAALAAWIARALEKEPAKRWPDAAAARSELAAATDGLDEGADPADETRAPGQTAPTTPAPSEEAAVTRVPEAPATPPPPSARAPAVVVGVVALLVVISAVVAGRGDPAGPGPGPTGGSEGSSADPAPTAPAARAVTVELLDGRKIDGDLVAIDEDGVRVLTSAGPEDLALEAIAAIDYRD